MEEAVLDYLLVEELDKIVDKFVCEDKGLQLVVMYYRGLAIVEMSVAIGCYSIMCYGLVELELKIGCKYQFRRYFVYLCYSIIGDSKYGDLRQNRSGVEYFGFQRLMLYVSQLLLMYFFIGESLIIYVGLDDIWMQVLL